MACPHCKLKLVDMFPSAGSSSVSTVPRHLTASTTTACSTVIQSYPAHSYRLALSRLTSCDCVMVEDRSDMRMHVTTYVRIMVHTVMSTVTFSCSVIRPHSPRNNKRVHDITSEPMTDSSQILAGTCNVRASCRS